MINLDIKTLKNIYTMNKSHCTTQLDDWVWYSDSYTDPLVSDTNLTFSDTDSLAVTTEFFEQNTTIYLKNVKKYGTESALAVIQLDFYVYGCNLIPLNFTTEKPEEPRRSEYRTFNDFPYQLIHQQDSFCTTKSLAKNMDVAFTTGDVINCPVTEFKIEYINEVKFDQIKQGTEADVTEKVEMDTKTGVFTIKNCTEPM